MSFTQSKTYRYLKKTIKIGVPLGIALYFIPWITLIFFVIGFIDASRNRPLTWSLLYKYFFGNGTLTWVLAPFNLILDLVTLPFRNRGIYRLEDLPEDYQHEINEVVSTLKSKPEIIRNIVESSKTQDRTMVFFRWFGRFIDSPIEISEFDKSFSYIRSIGVSVFSAHRSTGVHFGPLRATIRVLYNLNRIESDEVFIEVGQNRNVWKNEPLFIFDDTLQHRSVNESNESRVCIFVDILRPSKIPLLLGSIVKLVQLIFFRANAVFYKNWKLVK